MEEQYLSLNKNLYNIYYLKIKFNSCHPELFTEKREDPVSLYNLSQASLDPHVGLLPSSRITFFAFCTRVVSRYNLKFILITAKKTIICLK